MSLLRQSGIVPIIKNFFISNLNYLFKIKLPSPPLPLLLFLSSNFIRIIRIKKRVLSLSLGGVATTPHLKGGRDAQGGGAPFLKDRGAGKGG